MKFTQHYSGSLSNMYTLENSKGEVLILELGVSWKEALSALNYDLSKVVGVLCTHEHIDHSKGIAKALQQETVCYMSPGTAKALNVGCERNVRFVRHGIAVTVKNFAFIPFNIQHDAQEPFGYIVFDLIDNESLLFVTDTKNITVRFKEAFNIAAIECSYDREILTKRVEAAKQDRDSRTEDPINESLAKRLLDSHLEKSNCMRYLNEFCDLSRCREIHLLHMSSSNIDKEATVQEFYEEFFIDVITV